MKTYKQKDLGYDRKATTAKVRIQMPDGSMWEIPAQIIADDRDTNYHEDKEDTIGYIRAKSLSEGELLDWAANNMNWEDVEEFAIRVERKKVDVDFQEGWCNGEKEIFGKI